MRSKFKRPRVKIGPKNTVLNEILSLKKTVRKLKPEVKMYPQYLTSQLALGPTGIVDPLTNIGDGDLYYEREGLKLRTKSVEIRGLLSVNDNASAPDLQTFRIWVVIDRQQVTSSAPTLASLLDSPTYGVISAFTPEKQGRFTVLFDKTYRLSKTDTREVQIRFKKYIDTVVTFNGTVSTDYQKNCIWVMYTSDQGTYAPSFSYMRELQFTDI